MRPTSLLLLLNNSRAQRMAATWPILSEHPAQPTRGFLLHWARMARVRYGSPDELGEALLAHGICRPDGTLDPVAESFLRAEITKHIPQGKKKGKENEAGKPQDG